MRFFTTFSEAVRGWFETPHTDPPMQCCSLEEPTHPLKPGEPMFYTGEPGELYCGAHAPAEEKPS